MFNQKLLTISNNENTGVTVYTVKFIISVFAIWLGTYAILCLTFHHLDSGAMFPKESLSFKDTFIDRSYIESLKSRYNKAGIMERAIIKNEHVFKNLMEFQKIDFISLDE